MKYQREDFQPVDFVPDTFFCPGCNASYDDVFLPSIGCPCEHYGTGQGSLRKEGVERYLNETR